MKRIVFCFDGTWNKLDGENPTNVARIAQSISRRDNDHNEQVIHYDEGVGTSRTEKWTGGILGHGLDKNIIEAYHFLVLNYEVGDQIYVFGFSRGAFTARSFVGLLRNCSIMSRRSLKHIRTAVNLYLNRDASAKPSSEASRLFRFEHCRELCLPGDREWRKKAYPNENYNDAQDLKVKFLGVWDSVGALGIPKHINPLKFFSKKYRFHDTKLSSFVEVAQHAVAADEKRIAFEPSLWSNLDDLNRAQTTNPNYQQLVFAGTHSAVGGGGPIRGLSDFSLEWIFKGARKQGLEFDLDKYSPIFTLMPDHRANIFNALGKKGWSLRDCFEGVGLRDRNLGDLDRSAIHPSLVRKFHANPQGPFEMKKYRPTALKSLWDAIQEMNPKVAIEIDEDQLERKELWDGRILLAPDKVRKYVIKEKESLEDIAVSQMSGPEDQQILFLHNQNVGILFDPEEYYAGMTIEIPIYLKLPEIEANPS